MGFIKVNSKDFDRLKIGEWTAYLQTDGTIIWHKPEGKVQVYATPHYNEPNEVAVDVLPNDLSTGDAILSTTFKLKGEFRDHDIQKYETEMKRILNILQ